MEGEREFDFRLVECVCVGMYVCEREIVML